MYPELHFGDYLTLSTYHTLGLVAAVLAIGITAFNFRRLGIPAEQTAFLIGAMGLGFMVGARGFNALTNPSLYTLHPEALSSLSWQNFSLLGGIAGGLVMGILAGRYLKKNVWILGDAAVYGLGAAIFVAKLGCFGNGCCFGVPTALPWGVTYPLGSTPSAYNMVKSLPAGDIFGMFASSIVSLHPTQLYEGVGALCALGLAVWLGRRVPASGSRLLIFLAGFSAVRLVSWELRVPPPTWGMGNDFYPVIYSALIIGSMLILILRNRLYKGGAIHDTCDNRT